MFRQHFGMKRNPFDKDVDIGDMYEGEDARELCSRLKYMTERRGVFLLVGEPGSGKTAALRKFASGLSLSLYKPLYLPLATLTVNDFYNALASLLGESPLYRKIDMFRQIQSAISTLHFSQRITPVIILDEIQMASSAMLDDLRMLFNFNMDSSDPFILTLVGSSTIRRKLALNSTQPLRQRIAAKYTMKGLSLQETSEYLHSRMRLAGVHEDVFTEQAVAGIHSYSNGLPREINNISVACLMYCACKKLNTVDEEAVLQANLELSA